MSNSAQINFITKDEYKQIQSGALNLIKEIVSYIADPDKSSLLTDFDNAQKNEVERRLDNFLSASLNSNIKWTTRPEITPI